jgi:pimeloyl-ACP methyl ester carboxylesterase
MLIVPSRSHPTVQGFTEDEVTSTVFRSSKFHVATRGVGGYQQRVIPVVGHNLPQEAPAVVADAVLELIAAPHTDAHQPG